MSLLCCARVTVVFFNVWFAIIGFVMLAVGGIVKFGFDFVLNLAGGVLGPLTSAIPSASNVTSSAQDSLVTMLKDLGIYQIIDGAAISILCIGLFLFIIGLLGCAGACCKVKVMLILYTILLSIIILAQIIAIILYFAMQEQATAHIKGALNYTVQNVYGGIQAFDGPSLGFNFAMVQFKCCGIDSYLDFYGAKKWERNYTTTINGQNLTFQLATPVACCKMSGEFPNMQPVDTNCTFTPTTINSNYQTGCYNAVAALTQNYLFYCLGALGGTGLFEIMLLAFAIIILVKNNKVEPE